MLISSCWGHMCLQMLLRLVVLGLGLVLVLRLLLLVRNRGGVGINHSAVIAGSVVEHVLAGSPHGIVGHFLDLLGLAWTGLK